MARWEEGEWVEVRGWGGEGARRQQRSSDDN